MVLPGMFAALCLMGPEVETKKPETYEQKLEIIEEKRGELGRRWLEAATEEQKDEIRNEARAFVVKAIIKDIFPAWKGMPWTMAVIKDGLRPDALMPGEKGKGISCSFFITSVLMNAGLKLDTRAKFARSIALHIERSLAPDPADLHRFYHVTPEKLEKKMVALGEGLYIVGLNCHIGFIVVKGKKARFVHASYIEPYKVVNERLLKSQAIMNSEKSGYVVTTLFQDDRLIEHWLEAKPVLFQKFGPGKKKGSGKK